MEAKDTIKANDYTAVYVVIPLVIIVIIAIIVAVYFYRKTRNGKPKGKLSTFSGREG